MFPLYLYFSDQQVKWSATQLWNNIPAYYCIDEQELIPQLLELNKTTNNRLQKQAQGWIKAIRSDQDQQHYLDQFLKTFSLETEEGVVLMSLAETLLRIPDQKTADALIEDKLTSAQWQLYMDANHSVLLNSTVWGLAISQHLISSESSPDNIFSQLLNRISRPVIRKALQQAMKYLGERFVFAPTIAQGVQRIHDLGANQTCSFDMLGEAAVTNLDAKRYFSAYLEAIETVANTDYIDRPAPSVSIKLSALCPRLEPLKDDQAVDTVVERMLHLVLVARNHNVQITIDAEESGRQELMLQIFSALYHNEICKDWGGLGIAVQAYSKRALPILGWLSFIADQQQTPIPVRLVKGAYWDTEIKLAQQAGLPDYPVYTQKQATDLSYQVCVQYLLGDNCALLQPQFASHNATTICHILSHASDSSKKLEFQRLHGMGEAIYSQILAQQPDMILRIYSPIGPHQQLLPYLVRRLLENGANSSFVLQQFDPEVSVGQLTQTPEHYLNETQQFRNSALPLPGDLFQPIRENSSGVILESSVQRQTLRDKIQSFEHHQWHAYSLINGDKHPVPDPVMTCSPYDLTQITGQLHPAGEDQVREAYSVTRAGFLHWNNQTVTERATVIKRFARLIEQHKEELIALCIREAGKSLKDAIGEIREAVDFCYYYAAQATKNLTEQLMPSVTGEQNILSYEGRGIFICISPWNFPLAIWCGQIVAALLAGNSVISKPASSTSLIAFRATELLFEAGLPQDALALLPGNSQDIGHLLTSDFRLAGIAFTGSTQAATEISRQLTQREGAPIVPFIAETGGQNAMIVDSTALPEQVIRDVIESAFNSAGQRCSALRVLYLQEDTADQIEAMLIGAINTLKVGNPGQLDTDIGPVINNHALQALHGHIEHSRALGRLIYEAPLSEEHDAGYFVAPTLIRLHTIDELSDEHFGPILHIIRYQADNLDRILEEINRTGYGLTLGIHSRNNTTIEYISKQARVGNIYINRNQIGAIVSSQPFGGMGLSGTGPKAGGPNYLTSFVLEKTCSTNTTASGGNQQLLNQSYMRE
ncbi:bifunctional proline dehydrogenase/L-glutamate gamma-semialdehyde dehydrogenase PutA [Amphritea balenae]|uniref:Bifunctional protein PutA n=1 Tax=Amphritea balenae TaxID=452629 RepID=A0A3P1SWK6_9GAMM|nr:bifunctional proline dehydrogenase/L-glutamate gamma-semialdehyde dehydrogenase PutA [Amphritea balenae]RRD01355.1 bifunctional proline dehydrogenase/L-glutamate gamma-semialdehyde dehydrogenase PutA [Amphritea balenae]GGK57853.1 bifunctional protein PutA [Amphritea balenae]